MDITEISSSIFTLALLLAALQVRNRAQHCRPVAIDEEPIESYQQNYINFTHHPFNRYTPKRDVSAMAKKFRTLRCGYFFSPWYKLTQKRQRRVIGGRILTFEFPWAIFLESFDTSTICGGVLISHFWVVTAGHCLPRLHYVLVYNFKRILVDKAILHEDFFVYEKGGLVKNDIGLIKLKEPVCLTDALRPVCLPLYNYDFENDFDSCYVTGFGKTDANSSELPDYRKALNVTIMPQSIYSFLQSIRRMPVDYRQICIDVGDEVKSGACGGDSGSALSCKVRGRYYLAGIVSFGTINCSSERYPGVFTRIYEYIDWILSNVDYDDSKVNITCR